MSEAVSFLNLFQTKTMYLDEHQAPQFQKSLLKAVAVDPPTLTADVDLVALSNLDVESDTDERQIFQLLNGVTTITWLVLTNVFRTRHGWLQRFVSTLKSSNTKVKHLIMDVAQVAVMESQALSDLCLNCEESIHLFMSDRTPCTIQPKLRETRNETRLTDRVICYEKEANRSALLPEWFPSYQYAREQDKNGLYRCNDFFKDLIDRHIRDVQETHPLNQQVSLFNEPAQTLSITNRPTDWRMQIGSSCTGKNVKVAVLDTGACPHQQYAHQIKDARSLVAIEHSWNDAHGHGTHCTGIISQIAPLADLYVYKVVRADGVATLDDTIRGLDEAIKNQVNIISMSVGWSYSSLAFEAKINQAKENGIAIVCAAANSGKSFDHNVTFPARFGGLITVGSHDFKGNVSKFSSQSHVDLVDCLAPGESILSCSGLNEWVVESGTSMATPHVAGLCALVMDIFPNYTFSCQKMRDVIHYLTNHYMVLIPDKLGDQRHLSLIDDVVKYP